MHRAQNWDGCQTRVARGGYGVIAALHTASAYEYCTSACVQAVAYTGSHRGVSTLKLHPQSTWGDGHAPRVTCYSDVSRVTPTVTVCDCECIRLLCGALLLRRRYSCTCLRCESRCLGKRKRDGTGRRLRDQKTGTCPCTRVRSRGKAARTHTETLSHTHARTRTRRRCHTHTHAHAHGDAVTHTHTHTRTHTQTHTHTQTGWWVGGWWWVVGGGITPVAIDGLFTFHGFVKSRETL